MYSKKSFFLYVQKNECGCMGMGNVAMIAERRGENITIRRKQKNKKTNQSRLFLSFFRPPPRASNSLNSSMPTSGCSSHPCSC